MPDLPPMKVKDAVKVVFIKSKRNAEQNVSLENHRLKNGRIVKYSTLNDTLDSTVDSTVQLLE